MVFEMKNFSKVICLAMVLFFPMVIMLDSTKIYAQSTNLEIIRLDRALDDIVPVSAHLEKLADLVFLEGPVWDRKGGYLLFEDLANNTLYKWTADGKVFAFAKSIGFTRDMTAKQTQEVTSDVLNIKETNNGRWYGRIVGAAGTTIDPGGRLVVAQGGDRAVVRLEKDSKRTILADRYEGKRLNSQNDLVYKSDGALYFTDPSSSLTGGDSNPTKELPFNGVYLLKDGRLRVITKDYPKMPNGLAFTPDEKHIYLVDTAIESVLIFDVLPDDTVANGRVFVDLRTDKTPRDPLSGLKVDRNGNLYATGPGGMWVVSPEGKHLGTIKAPTPFTNMAFGDADGKTLYITSRTGELYRTRLKVEGIRP